MLVGSRQEGGRSAASLGQCGLGPVARGRRPAPGGTGAGRSRTRIASDRRRRCPRRGRGDRCGRCDRPARAGARGSRCVGGCLGPRPHGNRRTADPARRGRIAHGRRCSRLPISRGARRACRATAPIPAPGHARPFPTGPMPTSPGRRAGAGGGCSIFASRHPRFSRRARPRCARPHSPRADTRRSHAPRARGRTGRS